MIGKEKGEEGVTQRETQGEAREADRAPEEDRKSRSRGFRGRSSWTHPGAKPVIHQVWQSH